MTYDDGTEDQAQGPHDVSEEADRLVADLRSGNRVALAKAITLVESTSPGHQQLAEAVLTRSAAYAVDSIRVGFSGIPGAGKSTLIEKLGVGLIDEGSRIAVLAVDPSSTQSGGSILGDKTRMGALSRAENAFIRPTPSRGSLGGVSARTREAITLCEAAGYDVIFVETVGVGQSESDVANLTDFVFLLVVAGGGDDLQGIKRGVIEYADTILVTKADGDNAGPAEAAVQMYHATLGLFAGRESGWKPAALAVSAHTGRGLDEAWAQVNKFRIHAVETGYWQENRVRQRAHWLRASLVTEIQRRISSSRVVAEELPRVEALVRSGVLTPRSGATRILRSFMQSERDSRGSTRDPGPDA
jgi:LAO/AO transport system kinase